MSSSPFGALLFNSRGNYMSALVEMLHKQEESGAIKFSAARDHTWFNGELLSEKFFSLV